MKFQYFLGLAPMFVQDLKNRALHVEKLASALNNMVRSNTKVASILLEYEKIGDCPDVIKKVLEEITNDLSDAELLQLNLIIINDALSREQKAARIAAILGEPGFCIPEFLEAILQIAFCGVKCVDGFCEADEANEAIIEEVLTDLVADYGCELVLDDVCKVFNGITGDAASFSAVGFGGVIALINIMVNGVTN
eukprot:snap_masked-scaffold_44-processed-gene-1.36-mRNA-1 protein AED:1.00 eAED:1.00 QI:0/0/0/0/1/1/2/0/193